MYWVSSFPVILIWDSYKIVCLTKEKEKKTTVIQKNLNSFRCQIPMQMLHLVLQTETKECLPKMVPRQLLLL